MNKQRELEEKTDRVVRLLAAENLGGVLVGAQHNFAWLTGGGRNGIDLSREAGAGALFVRRDGRRFVLANNIEMPRLLAEELTEQDYEPVEFSWEAEKAQPAIAAEHARALLPDNAPLGSDLAVGDAARVVATALARVRYQLTADELERYRALGRDAGTIVGEVARALTPGLSETEIARRTTAALAARGLHAVVALVAADERLARFRHPVPTAQRWEKVVMIVVCARRGGLLASLSRIVCAGAVPDELRRRTEATARVHAQLLAATRPGANGRELYEVAARAYAEAGFAGEQHKHHQGGACGYRTRDWVAHPACAEVVQINQAFAWNPSITGSKVEETCIAFGDNVEVLTTSPDWPSIQVEVAARRYVLPDVLPV
jgi:Xaa-Pro aminopeptidase